VMYRPIYPKAPVTISIHEDNKNLLRIAWHQFIPLSNGRAFINIRQATVLS
jgi:hypothetical protein